MRALQISLKFIKIKPNITNFNDLRFACFYENCIDVIARELTRSRHKFPFDVTHKTTPKQQIFTWSTWTQDVVSSCDRAGGLGLG